MSKSFSEIARATGFSTIGIDWDKYSIIQVLILPNSNVYNEMTITINTQRLKNEEYNNIGVSRSWYEIPTSSVHASVGFASGGDLSLEGCRLIAIDGSITDLLDNTPIIVYGV